MNKDRRGYLADLILHIDRILEAAGHGHDAFAESWIIQDAIIRNFEVMGEIVKRLGRPFTGQYPEIPWRLVTAFRDVMAHHYEEIQLDAVWTTILEDLPPLRAALDALLQSLPAEDDLT